MRILTLPVKTEYFNQIKSGEKKEEYRLCKDYWKQRLYGKGYAEVWITLGYPKRGDPKRTIKRKYHGYEIKTITHEEFGDKPVEVYAIKVN